MSAQLGSFYFFYEGLLGFKTHFGAGRKAFLRAACFSLLSAVRSFFCFLLLLLFSTWSITTMIYAFAVLVTYKMFYFLLSISPVVVPIQHLYRRPAILGYTMMQTAYYGLWGGACVSCHHYGVSRGRCRVGCRVRCASFVGASSCDRK